MIFHWNLYNHYKYNIKTDLKAPIYSGENIGEIEIYVEEDFLMETFGEEYIQYKKK